MKYFNRHHLAIVPLLSIFAMAPSVVESQYSSRSIASVEVVRTQEDPKIDELNRYSAMTAKVNAEDLLKDPNLNLETIKLRDEKLKEKLITMTEINKDTIKKEQIIEQRNLLETLVIDTHVLDLGLQELGEKKLVEVSEKEASQKSLLESKIILEKHLLDLEESEKLIAQQETLEEVPVIIADSDDPAIEGPKGKEETVLKADAEEPKKGSAEICEFEEKNQILTKQVEQLMADQNQIMKSILGMAQMMVNMFQNQQQNQMPNPYYANGNGFQAGNPYQYNQPFTAGNWVYHPSGFQPSQPNIFARPDQGEFYPDQVHQQQPSQWGLRPQMNFQDPRFNAPTLSPGPFGNDAFSFNLEQQLSPIISQL